MSQPTGPIYRIGSPPAGPAKPPRKTKNIIIAAAVASVLVILGCCAGIAAIVRVAPPDVDAAANQPRSKARVDTQPNSLPTTQAPAPPVVPPDDQTFSGKGDKVIKLSALDEQFFYLAVISHKGSHNFVVTALDANGEQIDLIINEIGSYSGTRPVSAHGAPAALKINADGTWNITVEAAQKAPVWNGSATGKGDAVYLIAPGFLAGLSTVKITHTGKSNFVVIAYGNRSDLLVNEIGAYSGEVPVPGSTVLIEIVADGSWSLTKS